jgi:hypothetical protein
MPQFLELPRELRDMIYLEVLTSCRLPPTDTKEIFWYRSGESKPGLLADDFAYSPGKAPSTCARFLVCNRQIYTEMLQTIKRAQHKGLLAVRLDCIAKDKMHYLTWLAVPLVKTIRSPQTSGSNGLGRVVSNWAVKVLAATDRVLGSAIASSKYHSVTTIGQLWIDIRLFEPSSTTPTVFEGPFDRTSWAICAVLENVLKHGPDIISRRDGWNDITIDEVIINVVPQFEPTAHNHGGESMAYIPVSRTTSAEHLLHRLVNVWSKLWAGDEFKARYYRVLLEKIKKVRICLNGETFRIRELAVELERGQAERRRIDMRNQ